MTPMRSKFNLNSSGWIGAGGNNNNHSYSLVIVSKIYSIFFRSTFLSLSLFIFCCFCCFFFGINEFFYPPKRKNPLSPAAIASLAPPPPSPFIHTIPRPLSFYELEIFVHTHTHTQSVWFDGKRVSFVLSFFLLAFG